MSPRADRDEKGQGFARFLATLRERWWVILLSVIVLGGLAFVVSLLLEPRYSATAQVRYEARGAEAVDKALEGATTAGLPENISGDALTIQTSMFAERVRQVMEGKIEASRECRRRICRYGILSPNLYPIVTVQIGARRAVAPNPDAWAATRRRLWRCRRRC